MDVRTGIKPPETTAVSPMGLAVLPEGKAIALSPLNKRRWENFKVNRRGYWALWIFLTMFVVSLFAEFIANDKPIFIYVNGQGLFPGCPHLSGHSLCQGAGPELVRHCSGFP